MKKTKQMKKVAGCVLLASVCGMMSYMPAQMKVDAAAAEKNSAVIQAQAVKKDNQNFTVKEESKTGTMKASSDEKGINGCSISYKKLAVITLTDLDATGHSDVSSAIQSALNYAKEHYDKDTMYQIQIPSGDFRLDKHLFIYSNTWLSLKKDSRLIKNYPNQCMIKSNGNGEFYNGYTGASNIVIEGGIWYTDIKDYKPGQESTAIRFGHGKNVYVKDVVVDGNMDGHHMSFCGVSDITIENCTFKKYVGENNKEAVQFDICHSENIAGEYGYYDDTCEKNVLVKNCTFDGLSRGIGAHSAVYGVYYQDIMIENCKFSDIDKQAVLAMNFKNFVVKNNKMTNVGSGVDFRYYNLEGENFYQPNQGTVSKVSAEADIKITGNTIETKLSENQSNSYGIYLFGGEAGGVTYRIKDGVISNNKITSAAHGIFLSYADDITVTGNTVSKITLNAKSAPSNGICLIASNKNKISKNVVGASSGYQIIGHGISLRSKSKDNVISDNKITKTKRAGIMVADGSSATLTKNKITSCMIYGIGSENAKVNVYSNQISGCKSTGIAILNGSSSCQIGKKGSGNTITKSGQNGITVNGSKTSKITVAYNKVTSCKNIGISVTAGASAACKKNTVSKNAGHGINVDSSKAVISNNTVSGNKGNGLNLYQKANVTVTGNKVAGNSRHGICATSSRGTISNNKVTGNKGIGICLLQSKFKVKGNQAKGNKTAEIYKK